jgi:glucuronide carrier protein
MFSVSTVAVYYARDVLGSADLYIVMTVVQTVAMVAASALVPRLVAAIGKKRSYVLAGVVAAAGGVGLALAPGSIPALGIACYGILGLGFGVINTLIFVFQADTVDYGEWRSGVRAEGGSYAVLSFTRKAGQGIGGAAAAFTIGLGGYVSDAAAQSDAALTSIRVAAGIVPALGVAAAAAIMLAYPLTEERFREIVREIAGRRAAARDGTAVVPGVEPAGAT